jgi:hypothetical protein
MSLSLCLGIRRMSHAEFSTRLRGPKERKCRYARAVLQSCSRKGGSCALALNVSHGHPVRLSLFLVSLFILFSSRASVSRSPYSCTSPKTPLVQGWVDDATPSKGIESIIERPSSNPTLPFSLSHISFLVLIKQSPSTIDSIDSIDVFDDHLSPRHYPTLFSIPPRSLHAYPAPLPLVHCELTPNLPSKNNTNA